MSKPLKLIQVARTYFNENSDTFESGIILQLIDGRYVKHCQDGYVNPNSEVEVKPDDFVQIEVSDTHEREQALKSAIANQIGMVVHPNHLQKTRLMIDELDKLMSSRATVKGTKK